MFKEGTHGSNSYLKILNQVGLLYVHTLVVGIQKKKPVIFNKSDKVKEKAGLHGLAVQA